MEDNADNSHCEVQIGQGKLGIIHGITLDAYT